MTNADFLLIKGALGDIGSAYHRRQKDVISNRVMAELGLSAGEGGLEEATIRNKLMDEKLKRELSQSTIDRNEAYGSYLESGGSRRGGGQIKGYIEEGAKLPAGFVRLPNGRPVRDPTFPAATKGGRVDPNRGLKDLDAQSLAITNHHIGDWIKSDRKTHVFTDDEGNGVPQEKATQFRAKALDNDGNVVDMVAPIWAYQRFLEAGINNPMGSGGAAESSSGGRTMKYNPKTGKVE